MRALKRALAVGVMGGLALSAAQRAAADTWGVPLDRGAGRGAITPAGDTDSFVVRLARGQKLTANLRSVSQQQFSATLVLLGPDGHPAIADFEPTRDGVRLLRYEAVETGLHELVVGGVGAETGEYVLKRRVTGSPRVRIKGLDVPALTRREVPFAAAGGARVRFSLRGRGTLPSFVALEDPYGHALALASDAVRSRANVLSGRGIVVPDGLPYGQYVLVVQGAGASGKGTRVAIDVKFRKSAKPPRRLPDDEPALLAATPGEAGAGTTLSIAGVRLVDTADTPLRLFVGGVEVQGREVIGTSLIRGKVPAGLTGAVDLALLNGDGHAAVLRGAVLVVPPPHPTSLTPVRGPAMGGTLVEVRGTGFRPGAAVTISGVPFPDRTEVVDEGLLRFVTPPFAQGAQFVAVLDPTGQSGGALTPFTFVAAPDVTAVRPSMVARLAGEQVLLEGTSFTSVTTVDVGASRIEIPILESSERLLATLPLLSLGAHDVTVTGEFGAGTTLVSGVTCFGFEGDATPPAGAASLTPSDLALCDYDHDGDLDLFISSRGGATLASTSLLRVLRNDGDGVFTDVTSALIPAVTNDDWRADTIALGDVAGADGVGAPDGWLDLVLGTTDAVALASTRSRVRILANQALPAGGRVFSDRTASLMENTSTRDDWTAADLWVGDLDGDGGVPEIVATHDAIPTEVTPIAPYYVFHESGTRVFGYSVTAARFKWQGDRLPHKLGSRTPVPGLPTCPGDECADDFVPFRGVSLAVADLDLDGRKDLAVVTPQAITVNGVTASSAQLGRNVHPNDDVAHFVDASGLLPTSVTALRGDIVLLGDVAGDPLPDLVVVSRSAGAGVRAVEILENRGLASTWARRTTALIPAPTSTEHWQAHAAALADVDGDGDLDIVLLTDAGPGGGRALRILRNQGELGFSAALTSLLPDPADGDALEGNCLAVGDLDDDFGLGLVIGRETPPSGEPGVRIVRRSVR